MRERDEEPYTNTQSATYLHCPDPPLELLSDVLERLEGYGSMVRTRCLRGEVPEGTVAALLRHEGPKVSSAAAIGEWHAEPRGKVRDGLLPDWRAAMLRASADEPINEALKADPALAHVGSASAQGRRMSSGSRIFGPPSRMRLLS